LKKFFAPGFVFTVCGTVALKERMTFSLKKAGRAVSKKRLPVIKWQKEMLQKARRRDKRYREKTDIKAKEKVSIVEGYFRKEHSEKELVEFLLKKQIEEYLFKQGLPFPPLEFKFSTLPNLLVVSSREKTEIKDKILLLPLSYKEREEIEEEIDRLGRSSLVLEIGGISTFPSIVSEKQGLKEALKSIVHEWVHHHLYFYPLGMRTALHHLGFRSQETLLVNETIADLVGREIAKGFYESYYEKTFESSFSIMERRFKEEVVVIKEKVDSLLFLGKVREAEKYMEERRLFLNAREFNFRKINQSYLAFHGNYPFFLGDSLSERIREIREESSSLKDFLKIVRNRTRAESFSRFRAPA